MKNLIEIREAITLEIQKNEDQDYFNTEEAFDKEVEIISAYKEYIDYDIEEDEDAIDYFLKANIVEIWQYHLDTIIPKLYKIYLENALKKITKSNRSLEFESDEDVATIYFIDNRFVFILNGKGLFSLKTKAAFIKRANEKIITRNLKLLHE